MTELLLAIMSGLFILGALGFLFFVFWLMGRDEK